MLRSTVKHKIGVPYPSSGCCSSSPSSATKSSTSLSAFPLGSPPSAQCMTVQTAHRDPMLLKPQPVLGNTACRRAGQCCVRSIACQAGQAETIQSNSHAQESSSGQSSPCDASLASSSSSASITTLYLTLVALSEFSASSTSESARSTDGCALPISNSSCKKPISHF